MTYRYRLNADEAVTIRLFSKGGGRIWIRARKPDRAPEDVFWAVWVQERNRGPVQTNGALRSAFRAHLLGALDTSPKTYREEISWPG